MVQRNWSDPHGRLMNMRAAQAKWSVMTLAAILLCLSGNGAHARRLMQEDSWEADRDALLDFRNHITKAASSRLPSWGNSEGGFSDNPCSPRPWYHVECTAGRVTGLSITDRVMEGKLSIGLRNMTQLTKLEITGNKLDGAIPEEWGEGPSFFPNLEYLDLHENQFNSWLPKWGSPGAFPSLKYLNLGENRFIGGLPGTWRNGNKIFAKLEELHLHDNKLGYEWYDWSQVQNRKQYNKTSQWCPTAGSADGSWCPPRGGTKGADTHMKALRVLRLSNNGFRGALPTKWPRMFPNLVELWLDRNFLYSRQYNKPHGLPSTWIKSSSFPSLSKLFLYPGNDYICFVLELGAINGGAGYDIYMTGGELVDVANPWVCPDAKARSLTAEEEEEELAAVDLDEWEWADRTDPEAGQQGEGDQDEEDGEEGA